MESPTQLMAMNGSCFLSLQLWMARAKTSFPAPLSPRSKTVDLLAAAFLAVSIACSHLWAVTAN